MSSCHVINHTNTAVNDSLQPLPPKKLLLENLSQCKHDGHGGYCWEMIVIVVDVVVDMLMSVCWHALSQRDKLMGLTSDNCHVTCRTFHNDCKCYLVKKLSLSTYIGQGLDREIQFLER